MKRRAKKLGVRGLYILGLGIKRTLGFLCLYAQQAPASIVSVTVLSLAKMIF